MRKGFTWYCLAARHHKTYRNPKRKMQLERFRPKCSKNTLRPMFSLNVWAPARFPEKFHTHTHAHTPEVVNLTQIVLDMVGPAASGWVWWYRFVRSEGCGDLWRTPPPTFCICIEAVIGKPGAKSSTVEKKFKKTRGNKHIFFIGKMAPAFCLDKFANCPNNWLPNIIYSAK